MIRRPMQQPPQFAGTAGLAWQLSQLARQPGLRVYVCPSLRSYRQLSEELAFFLQDSPKSLWKFPAWEVLPYDRVSPHHALVGDRFATLGRLTREPDPQGLVLTSLPAFLQRIAPPEVVAAHAWQLSVGTHLDIVKLKEMLSEAGMQATERVLMRGEMAGRGSVLDVWPATENEPLRIDLFGDEIDSIRRFDIDSQRSGESLDCFTSVPAREVILDETGRERFAAAFRARFPQLRKHPMLEAAQKGRPHPGIEALLPLAYDHTARLIDYLPEQIQTFAPEDIENERLHFAEQVRSQFEMVRMSKEPVLAPQELYAIETALGSTLLPQTDIVEPAKGLESFQSERQPLHAMLDTLKQKLTADWSILLVGHGPGQQERMLEVCAALVSDIPHCHGLHNAPKGIATAIGYLDEGFSLPKHKQLILTGRELLGQRLPRRNRKSSAVIRADVFGSLQELQPGHPVVHEDHGVGLYQGLTSMESGGVMADFLHIEYGNEASIYLPVEDLDRLHRYSGDDNPELNRLGAPKWKKTRERVERDLLVMAHELIEIDAARQGSGRPPYQLEGESLGRYDEFSARFPFEETDDQLDAIHQVLADLAKDKPMDRVICGDVGFGKTEVAMRAAFVVAEAGKQVAVLAPTTVLANQHFASFSERFAGTGLRIELLSRQQGKAQSDAIATGINNGDVRIVIGTHRLLSEAFRFADLGLVIVDEEQRFGVKHKEKLKALHHGADLLTLTATPIPRTLHQTLSGLRAVSIISTPPAEREAIRTMVSEFDMHLAAEAIRREIYRGGQIYYLHNHVGSIERIAKRLREAIPEAEIGIAHGQMTPGELDRAMLAFYEGRLHILVCTTIIESGLDVPNANTLIVERADMLGLSQLHQIRGRVGRSHRQAYAYLFTPDARAMTPDARERLQAIAEHTELGAGFMLARQDMEIRGAGNLLGEQQSGHIEAIGLDLYLDMLSDAVAEARGVAIKPHAPIEMRLKVNAILPPDYIPQVGERLTLYRRIARTETDAQISMLFEEMTDRFGKLPDEAKYCLETARLRWRARAMQLAKLDSNSSGTRFTFTAESPIDPGNLIMRVQKEPSRFRLTPDGNLTLQGTWASDRERLQAAADFLDELLKK